jgi:hypothetical protein
MFGQFTGCKDSLFLKSNEYDYYKSFGTQIQNSAQSLFSVAYSLDFLQRIDAPVNAGGSLHVTRTILRSL